jgi:hypothetical protein
MDNSLLTSPPKSPSPFKPKCGVCLGEGDFLLLDADFPDSEKGELSLAYPSLVF